MDKEKKNGENPNGEAMSNVDPIYVNGAPIEMSEFLCWGYCTPAGLYNSEEDTFYKGRGQSEHLKILKMYFQDENFIALLSDAQRQNLIEKLAEIDAELKRLSDEMEIQYEQFRKIEADRLAQFFKDHPGDRPGTIQWFLDDDDLESYFNNNGYNDDLELFFDDGDDLKAFLYDDEANDDLEGLINYDFEGEELREDNDDDDDDDAIETWLDSAYDDFD